MVRIHPDPPDSERGAVAQLGEHLLCKQGVVGSIPISSTTISGQQWAVGDRQKRKLLSAESRLLKSEQGCSLKIRKK